MTHATPDDLDARAADLDRAANDNQAVGLPSHTQRANARTLRALAAEARQYEEIRMSSKDNVIQFPAPQNRRIGINPDGMRAVKALPAVVGESDEAFALRVVTAYVRGCGA